MLAVSLWNARKPGMQLQWSNCSLCGAAGSGAEVGLNDSRRAVKDQRGSQTAQPNGGLYLILHRNPRQGRDQEILFCLVRGEIPPSSNGECDIAHTVGGCGL